jgi:hypothetical protein
MVRGNWLRAASVTLVAIGLCACPPVTTKTPLGTTVASTTDPALAGMWKGQIGTDPVNIFTFLPEENGLYLVMVVTPPADKKNDGWSWGQFVAQPVTLGPNHFLNVHETVSNGTPSEGAMADSTFPLLYRINRDGTLTLYMIDEDAAKKLIQSGKLEGTIEQGQYGDVVLTAPPRALDAFMATQAGRALFVAPLTVLHRVQ